MRLILFTDLDGTLLDYSDYSAAPAGPALARCQALGVPVIPATSKTRQEAEPIRRDLGLTGPFIVENGAALYLPEGHPVSRAFPAGETEPAGPRLVRRVFGRPKEELVAMLVQMAGEAGLPVRGLSEMDAAEVAERTGLPLEEAERACLREFSEPFVVDAAARDDDAEGLGPETEAFRLATLAALRHQAQALGGLRVTLGDRFFHLQGEHDKGTALRAVMEALNGAAGVEPGGVGGRPAEPAEPAESAEPAWRSLALGDSFNDSEMLATADEAVLVRRHDGTWAPGVEMPGLIRTVGIGPAGWNEAVLERLDRLEHPGPL